MAQTEVSVSGDMKCVNENDTALLLDRVSVPSPIAIDILMDTMARDRVHMYVFSV